MVPFTKEVKNSGEPNAEEDADDYISDDEDDDDDELEEGREAFDDATVEEAMAQVNTRVHCG